MVQTAKQRAARVLVRGCGKANDVHPVDVAFEQRVSVSFGPLTQSGCSWRD